MTDDIVERLREGTSGSDVVKTDPYLNSLMQRSADEIERLRTELETIRALARKKLKNADGLDRWHKYGEGYSYLTEFVQTLAGGDINE